MPRPSLSPERRREFMPIVARTFAELGYRRTTTAILAERCEVRENILYRLWPDKKAMFIAAIDHVYANSARTWKKLLAVDGDKMTAAERLLAYESEHHGEFGQYRIVFAGLNEVDDPEIRAALREMYKRYHRLIERQVVAHRTKLGVSIGASPDLVAWAVIGLGTMSSIGRELGMLKDADRRRVMVEIGRALLPGRSRP